MFYVCICNFGCVCDDFYGVLYFDDEFGVIVSYVCCCV